jgi:hypothetical protein
MRVLLVAALVFATPAYAQGLCTDDLACFYKSQRDKKAADAKARLILLKKQAEINLAIENKVAEYQKLVCDRLGEAKVGMTPDEVVKSCWGKPARVTTTQTATGRSEQWIYRSGYVYLTDGIVTAIQTSR